MGKGRPRAVEKGVLGHGYGAASSSPAVCSMGSPGIPPAPVFYPTDDEFRDPLEYISMIRPQAEPYGICRIVPPKSWKPPFARDLDAFTFPTKRQAIHRLQARPPSCDSTTFELEYGRFLERHVGKKTKRKVIFDEAELDLCRLFNAVKRYGGYEKVCDQKKWGDVARFMQSGGKISECSKHVLCQIYREHLYDYEEYLHKLNLENKKCKRSREQIPSYDKEKNLYRKKRRNSVVERSEVWGETSDQICEQCKSGLHGDVMLLCDRCDKGWHLYCLSPPLERVPSGNWYCLECINSDKDSFGFVPGKQCSLEAFKRMNERTRRKRFGQGHVSRLQMEKQFWEIVEGKAGELEVMYGSDLDTHVYGSGFPRAGDSVPPMFEVDVWKEYVSSPWNLNNLPKLQGSMLRVVHDNIAGVMVPWLYVGMLFSSFCWHVEDHCFYSINYLHWGEPKCWYGVPGREASAFEQVMRNTLPDLFDAQPDLLFQLVTMLNPSVLKESGVPVYNVMQEPGTFVITFPKSFHGGFNFGLNCAEAVNFAPADWLPHGGFGAELYRLYRRTSVLSHEELLFVAAKNGCDMKALPYLREELCRIFSIEKSSREELWKKGIVKSSVMVPKKHPMYVGTEEDNTCIICQQYLYLSAIVCSCNHSSFVCLKHWKNLCECDTSKHRLLYRYSLAEIDDFISMNSFTSHVRHSAEIARNINSQRIECSPAQTVSITKKAKDGQVTYAQLAEAWLSKSHQVFESPFSRKAYVALLNEAEQFLWAGHDMDPVRRVASKLIDAQKWALSVKDCLFKVEMCSYSMNSNVDKVSLGMVKELLSIDPEPCYEPALAKLKVYADDAKKLIAEIRAALSSGSDIVKLESMLSNALRFPIDVEETKILATEISSVKIWKKNAEGCLLELNAVVIDIDFLNKLNLEMENLCVQLPEMDLLEKLSKEVNSVQTRCKQILKCPLKMQELEYLLKDTDKLTVRIPELEQLRQLHSDASSWIHHFNSFMDNMHGREDHDNIVRALYDILNAGKLLKVQVDELQFLEAELERARCREKAMKALQVCMPLKLIQEVLSEATLLEIKNEKLFLKLSEVNAEAISWEGRASFVLKSSGSMAEFESVLRDSEIIYAIPPSLSDLKDAISMTQSWIRKSQPYLTCSKRTDDVSSPLLGVEDLKELVKLSKNLKINLNGPERLESILKEICMWESNACSLLEDTMCLFDDGSDLQNVNLFMVKIEELLCKINSTIKEGLSMCVELSDLPKLKHASRTLQWCLRALSFCTMIPLVKDVDDMLEDAYMLPTAFLGCNLVQTMSKGISSLRKALILLPEAESSKKFGLKEVEDVLEVIKKGLIPFPVMVAQLQYSIEKHKSWTQNVHQFFSLSSGKCWASLMELEGQGLSVAFDCPELSLVSQEVEKVEKWMRQCDALVKRKHLVGTLSLKLRKIKDSMDRALSIYQNLDGIGKKNFHTCCPNYFENSCSYKCVSCEDRYHFACLIPSFTDTWMRVCPFCCSMESGEINESKRRPLISRKRRLELKSFVKVLYCADESYAGIEELDLMNEILKLSTKCQSNLSQIVNCVNLLYSKDMSSVSKRLICALKATAVAGIYDHVSDRNLRTAFLRHTWKVRINTLLRRPTKPTLQQIQQLEEEGRAMRISDEDHFMREIAELVQTSLHWVDNAEQVASDSSEVELSRVFELMNEGNNLPIQIDEQMKLLKTRSMLYCICRKPDENKPMIACDQCDEWYHFECINLLKIPSSFFCPACKPPKGEFISFPRSGCQDERSNAAGEPATPACIDELKRSQQSQNGNFLKCCSKVDSFPRMKRRHLQRTSRKH